MNYFMLIRLPSSGNLCSGSLMCPQTNEPLPLRAGCDACSFINGTKQENTDFSVRIIDGTTSHQLNKLILDVRHFFHHEIEQSLPDGRTVPIESFASSTTPRRDAFGNLMLPDSRRRYCPGKRPADHSAIPSWNTEGSPRRDSRRFGSRLIACRMNLRRHSSPATL